MSLPELKEINLKYQAAKDLKDKGIGLLCSGIPCFIIGRCGQMLG
jgi:hypothetical protein